MERAELRVISKDDGTVLDIAVQVWGNFGAGEEDAAMELVSDFKERFLEQVGGA